MTMYNRNEILAVNYEIHSVKIMNAACFSMIRRVLSIHLQSLEQSAAFSSNEEPSHPSSSFESSLFFLMTSRDV